MKRWQYRWIKRNVGLQVARRSRPSSPDGSRKCANCARNQNCPKPSRTGNHVDCFMPYDILREQKRDKEGQKEMRQFAAVMGGIVAVSCAVLILIFVIPYALGI